MKKTSTIAPKKVTTSKAVVKKVAVKKVAAKTTVKKAAVPKVAVPKRKKSEVRPLVTAPDPQSFWTNDGQILNSLTALAESFAAMDTILYKYHVQNGQNDFADWVESVLADEQCAAALRKAKTPKSAHTIVIKHLRFYA